MKNKRMGRPWEQCVDTSFLWDPWNPMFPVSRLFCVLMVLQHVLVSDGCRGQEGGNPLLPLFGVKTQDDPD